MLVIGTNNRKAKDHSDHFKTYNIRRLQCTNSGTIHHELPDLLIPYKGYEAECIENVLTNPSNHLVPADDSTLSRWHGWFQELVDYWIWLLDFHHDLDQTGKHPPGLHVQRFRTALQK